MARTRTRKPIRVLLNSRVVGRLLKESSGAIEFQYAPEWLDREHPIPVSLSLPLRKDAFKGAPVAAVFENLLPDSEMLRRRVAEKVGADGTDAYSLLAEIGRDCVGALQFLPEDEELHDTGTIRGEEVSPAEIEAILNNLQQAPLGLNRNKDFRISLAGAQEKTALLFHEERWLKPIGTTPTTHLFKTPIGTLQNGIDLSNSVENEFYCLKLLGAFGLQTNNARIETFGKKKTLVIERFDRLWTKDGRLLRLPMEDCCQALSTPPSRKYQPEGGPGIAEILKLLAGSDQPAANQKTFLKAQILFWLIGATDGHAKNFSIFLGPEGSFQLTPIYDVLTAQPSVDVRKVHQKQFKLAMSVGDKRHYTIRFIKGRHFVQSAEQAGIAPKIAHDALHEIGAGVSTALESMDRNLPPGFPEEIHASVRAALLSRLPAISE